MMMMMTAASVGALVGVRAASCGRIRRLHEWESKDDPQKEHRDRMGTLAEERARRSEGGRETSESEGE